MNNETIKTILNRHSARQFLEKEISDEHKNLIFEAIKEAPSAGNMQTYSVINVTSKDIIEKLSVLCDNQPFINSSKMVLLFVTNPLRYYEVYNMCNEQKLKPTLADYYLNLNDALIAAHNAVIAAESLGIGSCYIGDIVENYEEIKSIFKLPKYVNPACLLVFGYKTKEGASPKRFSKNDLIVENEFKTDYLGAFSRKLEVNDDEIFNQVNRIFNRKIKSDFFKEMNRSFKLMIDEFKE